jgi:hypothetical protein
MVAPREIFKLHIPFQIYCILFNREEMANKTSKKKYCRQKEENSDFLSIQKHKTEIMSTE